MKISSMNVDTGVI